jgi:hypothetical protein
MDRCYVAAPVGSFVWAANGPARGGSILTLSGMNIGEMDPSPSMSIGATQCTKSSWISTTSIVCTARGGEGAQTAVAVRLASQMGTLLGSFAYDGALRAGSAPRKSSMQHTAYHICVERTTYDM